MPSERNVAGIRCGEVLARLSDYLDGRLSPDEVAQIEDHLRGCNWCEEFGGAFTHTVQRLREQLRDPEPLDPAVARRLGQRLATAPAMVDGDEELRGLIGQLDRRIAELERRASLEPEELQRLETYRKDRAQALTRLEQG